MKSYTDSVNPNLALVLTFIGKVCWLLLAAFFGIIGYKLYALGIDQRGNAKFGVFSLTDAGPGLVVMVCALACALSGAIRSKVTITPKRITVSAAPTPPVSVENVEVSRSARECKLFGGLLKYLATRHTFVILNSFGQIDIESLAWSAVPTDIQKKATSSASKRILSGQATDWIGPIGEWNVECKAIQFAESGKTWCVVCVDSRTADHQRSMVHEDIQPIFV